MGVLHDVEDALPVLASSAEAVEEVAETIFVEGTGHQQSHYDGHEQGQVERHDEGAEVERGCHDSAGEPSHQRPVLDNRSVAFLRRLVEAPEGQTGEKDERRPDAVVPFRLVDIDFHSEIFGDVCVVEVVHFVHHAHCAVDDGEGAEGASALAELQSEAEQWARIHELEHAPVSALVAAVAEHHVGQRLGIEARRSECTGRHDEAVDHDEHPKLGSTEHGSDGGDHFEAAEVTY